MICPTCEGCGQVAKTPDGEPWSLWELKQPGLGVAVAMGFIRPVTCKECNGTGFEPIRCDHCRDIKRIQCGSRFVDCPKCNNG